jgi:hypothetical protein
VIYIIIANNGKGTARENSNRDFDAINLLQTTGLTLRENTTPNRWLWEFLRNSVDCCFGVSRTYSMEYDAQLYSSIKARWRERYGSFPKDLNFRHRRPGARDDEARKQ